MTDEKDTIQFIQNHQPPLKSGNYLIEVTLDNLPPSDDPLYKNPNIKRCFTVSGERFALKPADIHAVFPPAGSLGEHSNVLPHIILNRSTLPWERAAVSGGDESKSNEMPWLALLLFDEGEAPKPEVITLDELKKSRLDERKKPQKVFFPDFEIEPEQEKDKITIIDAPKETLENILPSSAELKYLAHVRRGTDLQEFAVIIGNRLPKRGGTSIVHLVSLEGRYGQDENFDDQGAVEKDYIRLVSLYTWRFACEDEKQSFKNLLLNLIPGAGTLRLQLSANHNNVEAEKYLAMGCVPLPHTTRRGDKIVSWYHGPLLPGENVTKDADVSDLLIRNSDQLLRFNLSLGLLDVSYAAAWELGHFLALQNKTFSTELFNWKWSCTQRLQEAERVLKYLPLRVPGPSLDPPRVITTWFEQLERLEGIPFNYLVPDEHMLPLESIRFFFLDWLWLECLQDGALSTGRVTSTDSELHKKLKEGLNSALTKDHLHLSTSSRRITGFLLRSDVVSGWPDLLVDGYGSQGLISLSHMERLSKSILICLFDGELTAIDIHLKPETMHFGVNRKGSTNFDKQLRTADGKPSEMSPIDVPWRHDESVRVVNIEDLAAGMGVNNSAQFAFQMIEGAEKVRFTL